MPDTTDKSKTPSGFIIAIVRTFLTGPLSVIIIVLALLFGAMAISLTPREEEPQIVVPMVDVTVSFPGHSPEEVEQLVTVPLERILWQVEGVEHVYSISRRDNAMVMVRFYVGEDRDRAMVKVRDKISENLNLVPHGVTNWAVDTVAIDDVPIVTLSVYSPDRTPYELRRIAEEMKARLDSLRDISLTQILGGYPREILIEPDPQKMAARKITFSEVVSRLQRNNTVNTVGKLMKGNRSFRLIVKPGLSSVESIADTVISSDGDRQVRLRDIAEVRDGPVEQDYYTNIGFGPMTPQRKQYGDKIFPAVTMAFSKKRGTNAVDVANNIIAAAEKLKGGIVPRDVKMVISRNYGETADRKVDDLISGMIFAIITVVGLMIFTMGWREALVVGMAVPVSFALALFTNYVFGYTINRVTLFALILSLGLVVDDPITNVDNIQRHIRMGLLDPFRATLAAVKEVIPPVIMSTLAIIVSFTPMFFITGMMGPYMGPMAINVPLTVSFSTLCALTFVPWMSYKLLKGKAGKDKLPAEPSAAALAVTPEWIRKLYRWVMSPFLKTRNAVLLLIFVVFLMFGAMALMLLGVPLKMLPYDNKNELELIVDLPEGSSLEETYAVMKELEKYLSTVNEVKDFEGYVGINAPIDFNGLVRHYNMRMNFNQADIRINLIDKTRRKQQSHSIALRLRDDLTAIAEKHNARLKIVEVPPGPPVLSTITVEVRGRPDYEYAELIKGAKTLEQRMRETGSRHITEIDDMSEAPHSRFTFKVNPAKAALHGLTANEITAELRTALQGVDAAQVRFDRERNPLYAMVRLPLADRFDPKQLGQLWLKGGNGKMVQLAELGHFINETEEQPIYHKNLERVVFVTAESTGKPPGELILKVWRKLWEKPLPDGIETEWAGEGEWQITLRVFRDLGIAFGVAMIGIFLLLIVQTNSIVLPLIIMAAIPLTIIGIAPGFYLLNQVTGGTVAGYPDPVFFTATGMIGMIALGGIVIRNSIVLIEFIQDSVKAGNDLKTAILESGAVRFRPIVLTAATTMIGAWPITFDPIFSGLAWALIFGLCASTLFTLLVIPTVYMLAGPRKHQLKENTQ